MREYVKLGLGLSPSKNISTSTMLETFSESARKVVFWAPREAGRSGSEFIEPKHLLQGLLAEDQRDWLTAMGSIDETMAMQMLLRHRDRFLVESRPRSCGK